MEQFRKYIDCQLNINKVHDNAVYKKLAIKPRYIPEIFEFFDEMEFIIDYTPEKYIVIGIAIEKELIKRVMMGWAGKDEEDDAFNPLNEDELNSILDMYSEKILSLFDNLTAS